MITFNHRQIKFIRSALRDSIHRANVHILLNAVSRCRVETSLLKPNKHLVIVVLFLAAIHTSCNPSQTSITTPIPTTTTAATLPETEPPQTTLEPLPPEQTPTATLPTSEEVMGQYTSVDPSRQVVTFWHPFTGVYETALSNLIDDFNNSNAWGIRVEAAYQGEGEDLTNRMLTFMNTPDAPALLVANESQAATYQLGQALVDLDQFTSDPTWGLSEADLLDFYPGQVQQGIFPSFNGIRLTYPLFGHMNVLYYNLDWLSEMGYPSTPTNPEGFLEAACQATAQPFSGATASGRMGIQLNLSPSSFADWSLAFGSKLFNYGSNIYSLDSNTVNTAMTYLQTLVQRGCGSIEPFADGSSPSEAARIDFSRGVLLFVVDSTEKIPEYRSSIQAEANFNWRIAPFPHTTTNPLNNIQSTSASIPKTTPQKELAAWLFLKYFSSPEAQAKWVRETNALPVRAGAAEYLSDYFSASPASQMTLALLNDSTNTPVVPGYDQVKALSQQALAAILDGAEVNAALSELSVEANRILEEQLALIPESPDSWSEIDPGGQTIVFWHQQDEARSSILTEIITEFNATNKWGITVLHVAHEGYGEIFQNLLPVLGTEEAPNLVLAYQHHAGAYQEAGGLVNLESLLNSARWGLPPQEINDFYPAIFEQDLFPIFDGSRLGFPIQRSMDVLYYNADWLAELGYQAPPTSPEEFKEMACATTVPAQQASQPGTGYQFYLDATRFSSLVFAFGGQIFDEARNQFLFNGVGATSVINFLQDLIGSGCATTVSDRLTSQAAFSEGSLLFMIDSSIHIPTITDLVASEADFNWAVAPLPSATESPSQNIFGASISVPTSSQEKELAAWLFIKYLSEPQVQARWAQEAGYLPVRQSAEDFLTDFFLESPNYQVVFNLLQYGMTEPSLPGYDFIHQEVELALQVIFAENEGEEEEEEKINVTEILDSLNATANQILAVHLER